MWGWALGDGHGSGDGSPAVQVRVAPDALTVAFLHGEGNGAVEPVAEGDVHTLELFAVPHRVKGAGWQHAVAELQAQRRVIAHVPAHLFAPAVALDVVALDAPLPAEVARLGSFDLGGGWWEIAARNDHAKGERDCHEERRNHHKPLIFTVLAAMYEMKKDRDGEQDSPTDPEGEEIFGGQDGKIRKAEGEENGHG